MKIPVLDYRHPGPVERAWQFQGRILVDGKHIRGPFYVNQELGIVGSFDLLGDGKDIKASDQPELLAEHGVSIEKDGVLARWYRGKVEWSPETHIEVFAADGRRLATGVLRDLKRVVEDNERAERFPV